MQKVSYIVQPKDVTSSPIPVKIPISSFAGVLLGTAIVLWAVLFTEFPSLHDTLHTLRHSLYVIPCH